VPSCAQYRRKRSRREPGARAKIPPRNPERRARILGLLDRIAGETFRSERFPRFEFQIVRVARGERVAARWPEDPPSRYPEQTPFEWRETTDIRHAMMIRALR